MASTIGSIYNQLLLGDRIRMRFNDSLEAEQFRVRMAQWKSRQDKAMMSIGGMEQEDRMVFVFKYDKATCTAVLKFDERRDVKQYEFEIVADSTADNHA